MNVANPDTDADIFEIFLEEFAEETANLNESVTHWLDEPKNEAALTSARRSFHTLKGSARLVGAEVVGEFAWLHEDILNRVISGELAAGAAVQTCIADGVRLLPRLAEELKSRSKPSAEILTHAQQAIRVARSQVPESGSSDEILDAEFPDYDEVTRIETGIGDEQIFDLANALLEEDEAHSAVTEEALTEAYDPELLSIFSNEAGGHLQTLNAIIERLKDGRLDAQDQADLYRAMHTLHGSAKTAGVEAVYAPCGEMEHYLEIKSEHHKSLDVADDMALLSALNQHLRKVLSEIQGGLPTHTPVPRALLAQIESAIEALTSSEARVAEKAEHGESTPLVVTDESSASIEPSPELVDVFLEECTEILENCDAAMQRWQSSPEELAPVNDLRRELHTLKGSARMAGLGVFGDLSHAAETLLIDVAEQRVAATKDVFAVINGVFDRFAEMIGEARLEQQVQPAQDLLAVMKRVQSGQTLNADDREVLKGKGSPESEFPEEAVTASDATRSADDTADKVVGIPFQSRLADTLNRATDSAASDHEHRLQEAIKVSPDALDQFVDSVGEVNMIHSRVEQQISSFGFNLQELDQTVRRLTEQLRRLEVEAEAQILNRFDGQSIDPDETGMQQKFDPLELDRYSTIQQLSRSLAESTNDLLSIHQYLAEELRDVESLLQQQSRVSNELQDGLMRTRMSPFRVMLPRLRRVLRRTALELDKEVELRVQGETHEMDRKILEGIVVPIEHLLRNAVAHGIEPPEERRRLGKPDTGVVEITIQREGPEVIVEIADDGAGVNREAVLAKAIEQKLIERDAQPTDAEINSLILQPGFSTAAQVSQISGRGVGLDVVQTQLKQLNGVLSIHSQSGQGTRFKINLPFTLAINQSLLVQAGGESYAIPTNTMEGVIQQPGRLLLERLSADEPAIEYAGHRYHLAHLAAVLERGPVPSIAEEQNFPVILASAGEQHVALIVDEIQGNREVVVKSVGALLNTVPGIAGATIMGDGRVVLILDTVSLIRMAEAGPVGSGGLQLVASQEEDERPVVMVVDDSITIRKVTARMLERNNYHVVTAKDGLDAVAQLKEVHPDMLLLDIEMPRMDGFELASHIRASEQEKHLPIIMISSRTGKKHRERARDLGVNQFLGKPYQDSELLENIEALLHDGSLVRI